MNEKFYALAIEKQERIINAGFKVFSRNSYRKSPMQEIALEAGISKSLLFFYFRNKKELYLFLWQKVEEITLEQLKKQENKGDFFERMYQSLLNKLKILEDYPYILNFALRAYYENDPEVKDEVRKLVLPYTRLGSNKTLKAVDPSEFKEGLDLEQMYRLIYLASEGFVWQLIHSGKFDTKKMLNEYKKMIDFWRQLFHR